MWSHRLILLPQQISILTLPNLQVMAVTRGRVQLMAMRMLLGVRRGWERPQRGGKEQLMVGIAFVAF